MAFLRGCLLQLLGIAFVCILTPLAYIMLTFCTYRIVSHGARFTHRHITVYALDKIVLVNSLVVTTLIACRVLLRTPPMSIGTTEIAVDRIYAAINIVTYTRLTVCTGVCTRFTTLACSHLCYSFR